MSVVQLFLQGAFAGLQACSRSEPFRQTATTISEAGSCSQHNHLDPLCVGSFAEGVDRLDEQLALFVPVPDGSAVIADQLITGVPNATTQMGEPETVD